MSERNPRVWATIIGSCPRCRRLVEAMRLTTQTIVWDPARGDREDFTRLVGERCVGAQGFVEVHEGGGHECPGDSM